MVLSKIVKLVKRLKKNPQPRGLWINLPYSPTVIFLATVVATVQALFWSPLMNGFTIPGSACYFLPCALAISTCIHISGITGATKKGLKKEKLHGRWLQRFFFDKTA
jgi:cation transport ATPase